MFVLLFLCRFWSGNPKGAGKSSQNRRMELSLKSSYTVGRALPESGHESPRGAKNGQNRRPENRPENLCLCGFVLVWKSEKCWEIKPKPSSGALVEKFLHNRTRSTRIRAREPQGSEERPKTTSGKSSGKFMFMWSLPSQERLHTTVDGRTGGVIVNGVISGIRTIFRMVEFPDGVSAVFGSLGALVPGFW